MHGVLRVWDREKSFEHMLFIGTSGRKPDYGFTAFGTFWYFNFHGELAVHNTLTGQLKRSIRLIPGNVWWYSDGKKIRLDVFHYHTKVFASADEKILNVARCVDGSNHQVDVIDLESLEIIDKLKDLPGEGLHDPVDQPDAILYWPSAQNSAVRLLRYCKLTGEIEVSIYSDKCGGDLLTPHTPTHPSPCGKYWLMPDNTLPIQTIGGDLYFGLSLQVWEAFPLRFLRRVTCAWLPKEAFFASVKYRENIESRFIAISRALEEYVTDPRDVLERSWLESSFVRTDEDWQSLSQQWRELQFFAKHKGWQPDSEAFWLDTLNYFSCIGVDGTASPRLFCSQIANQRDKQSSFTGLYKDIRIYNDRKARVLYEPWYKVPEGGYCRLDGSPADDFWRKVGQGGEPGDWLALSAGDRFDFTGLRAYDFLARQSVIRIPLKSQSPSDCIKAIEKLRGKVRPHMESISCDGEIKIIFEADAYAMSEKDFFILIMEDVPSAKEALFALIETYCKNCWEPIFSNEAEAEGLLAYAALALATHDEESFLLLEQFGLRCHYEVEYVYPKQVVRKLLSVREYTEERHRFALRFMDLDYRNCHSSHEVWEGFGVKNAAIRQYSPDEYAALVKDEFADQNETLAEDPRFITRCFEDIHHDLEKLGFSKWERQFYEALLR